MACECTPASAQTETERATLRIALALNATMFVVGMMAGLLIGLYVAKETIKF